MTRDTETISGIYPADGTRVADADRMDSTQDDDPERHIEEAKASLLARMEELGRRMQEAREKLDLRAHIAAHPLPAIGIAFAAGLVLGFGRKGSAARLPIDEAPGRSIGAATVAMIGTLVFRLLKDIALRQAAGAAKTWWDQRQAAMGSDVAPSERSASHDPNVESFLRH
jgi:hypothetical protein